MLEEKILNDYKEALKSKDTIRVSTLSFLRSSLLNQAIKARKKSLNDEEVISVIKQIVKQHRDSIEQFKRGGRDDLVIKENRELEILESYLPPSLTPEEIRQIIEGVILTSHPEGPRDMGKVMKEVMSQIASRADGKTVSELVKQRLAQMNS